MLAKLADKVLDVVWGVTLPVSGTCPVCAFWRGVILGALATVLLHHLP